MNENNEKKVKDGFSSMTEDKKKLLKGLSEKVRNFTVILSTLRPAIDEKIKEIETLERAGTTATVPADVDGGSAASETAEKPVADMTQPAAEPKEIHTESELVSVEEKTVKPAPIKDTTFQPVENYTGREGTYSRGGERKPYGASGESPSSTSAGFKKKNVSSDKRRSSDDKQRKLSKKAKIQKGYEQGSSGVIYDEISGEIMKIRPRKSSSDKKKTAVATPAAINIDHAVMTSETISIKQLSEKIGKSSTDIIKKLFLEYGLQKTINDDIDFDTAELVSVDYGVTLKLQLQQTSEEKMFAIHGGIESENENNLTPRPPIVTIMGHVDHGKTSILDYIRKTHIAGGEAGGITQHIGASVISVVMNGEKRKITFLDTPGHEAFTAMRARGANVTDIVVIVIAADDGIMPQTVEAINHAKAANVPIIIAINKMDKQAADPEKVLTQLSENGILVEEWSGDVPAVKVSARTGMGIDSLLENILATADYIGIKANPNRSASGTIIEAKLDRGKGPVATVLVQNGTLKTGDFIVAGTAVGRIRAMFDDKGKTIVSAPPGTPVSVLGLQDVPNAGDKIMVVDEKLSKQVAEERKNREKISRLKTRSKEDIFKQIEEGKSKEFNIIVKADVKGSVEAVKQSLSQLSNDEIKVNIVHSGVGAINESDVTLADTTSAMIVGFNIRPDNGAKNLAEKSGVEIRLYRVIYDAINDLDAAIKGMSEPVSRETCLGRAEVRHIFHISGVGTVAGCYVKDGKITRNAKIRLLRDDAVVVETTIAGLKHLKDDVTEVTKGYDCGICLSKYNDVKENDVIEAFVTEEVRQS